MLNQPKTTTTLDPRIGLLQRNGKEVAYFFDQDGRYHEGDRGFIQRMLAGLDKWHSAKALRGCTC